VVADGDVDVCDFDPGYDVVGTVETSLRTLTEIWRGDVGWARAMLDGSVSVSGSSDVRRAVPSWLGQSPAAAIPRPA
jgi:putative sterol carrier protein